MIVFTSTFDWLIVYRKKLSRCLTVQAPVFILSSASEYNNVPVRMANCLSGYSQTSVEAIFSRSKNGQRRIWVTDEYRVNLCHHFQNVYWLLCCAAKSQFIMILTMFFSKFCCLAFLCFMMHEYFLRFQLTLIDGSFVLHSLHYMSDNLSEALIRRWFTSVWFRK